MLLYKNSEQEKLSNNKNEKQKKDIGGTNNTGIPDTVKKWFEDASGVCLDDVKVHYNSRKPEQLHALAYTKGSEIHIAPRQEKHLEHELGHVVQQKKGIVNPTKIVNGMKINDNSVLEEQADNLLEFSNEKIEKANPNDKNSVIQRKIGFEFQTNWPIQKDGEKLSKGTVIKRMGNTYIVSDDSDEEEYSDIEFVTEPLSDFEEVVSAYINMHHIAEWLLELCPKQGDGYEDNKDESVFENITVKGSRLSNHNKDFQATPQVSFGISLDKIYDIAQDARKYRSKLKFDPEYIPSILSHLNSKKALLKSFPKLNGLVQLINSYIIRHVKEKDIPYPKSITDHFLLSRTNFSELLYKTVFNNTLKFSKIIWLKLFDDNLFKHKLFPNITGELEQEEISNITVEEWLNSIYDNADLLDGRKKPDMESMGNMPLDTVKHDDQIEEVGVFELRSNQIPHYLYKEPKWSQYMAEWYVNIKSLGFLQ